MLFINKIISTILDPVHTEPDEYLFKYVLRSHETNETGRIRAQLTGRIRDPKKLGLTF